MSFIRRLCLLKSGVNDYGGEVIGIPVGTNSDGPDMSEALD